MSAWADDEPFPNDPDDEPERPLFTAVPFDRIHARETKWLVPGSIPAGDAVIFLGEEGIGKGLYWCHLLGMVTTGPNAIDAIIIVSEDDPERTVKPRLVAAGADVSRVHLMVADPETLTGVPLIPGQSPAVIALIEQTGARLVIIDPWLSVVPGSLQIKDTQQARQALDPVVKLTRQTGATVVLVTHTNRSTGGSARSQYGATVALRQAGRVCLMAVQDPSDPDVIYVGIEKANITAKGPATKYRKAGHGAAWSLTDTGESVGLTVSELLGVFDRDGDERTSERWTQVVLIAGANGGHITRAQVVTAYEGTPDPAKAADKAIGRWKSMDPPRLLPVTGQRGLYEVVTGAPATTPRTYPPLTPRDLHHITTGGMGSNEPSEAHLPPVPPAIPMGGRGEVAGGYDDDLIGDTSGLFDPWADEVPA